MPAPLATLPSSPEKAWMIYRTVREMVADRGYTMSAKCRDPHTGTSNGGAVRGRNVALAEKMEEMRHPKSPRREEVLVTSDLRDTQLARMLLTDSIAKYLGSRPLGRCVRRGVYPRTSPIPPARWGPETKAHQETTSMPPNLAPQYLNPVISDPPLGGGTFCSVHPWVATRSPTHVSTSPTHSTVGPRETTTNVETAATGGTLLYMNLLGVFAWGVDEGKPSRTCEETTNARKYIIMGDDNDPDNNRGNIATTPPIRTRRHPRRHPGRRRLFIIILHHPIINKPHHRLNAARYYMSAASNPKRDEADYPAAPQGKVTHADAGGEIYDADICVLPRKMSQCGKKGGGSVPIRRGGGGGGMTDNTDPLCGHHNEDVTFIPTSQKRIIQADTLPHLMVHTPGTAGHQKTACYGS
ncbi:hypothetical protein DFJ77DRAFT_443521 [Powellomyces hirtus]|nr:hypothetical protein DFJ77DRAFT_443521 [Powellomyces hirtus]